MPWMDHIENDPGALSPAVYKFTAVAGQTTFQGFDRAGLLLAYTPGGAGLLVSVNGAMLSPGEDYLANDGSMIVINAALAAQNEVMIVSFASVSILDTYTKTMADQMFVNRRNRVTNPGMRYSQEKGDTAQPVTGNVNPYIIDGFSMNSFMDGTVSAQRVKVATPGGAAYRLRATVTTAYPVPAANTYLTFQWRLEGFDIADFQWGTAANGKRIVIRFGCNLPAGDYNLALKNGGLTKCYLLRWTVTPAEAGTDILRAFIIPSATPGQWLEDSRVGLICELTLMSGTSVSVGAWRASNYYSHVAQSNFMATVGNVADIFDVGVFLAETPPTFELPEPNDDYFKCARYYATGVSIFDKYCATTGRAYGQEIVLPAQMRVAPTVSQVTTAPTNLGTAGIISTTDTNRIRATAIPTAIGAVLYTSTWTANARL